MDISWWPSSTTESNNWDLQAVVRGCCASTRDPFSSFGFTVDAVLDDLVSFDDGDESFSSFPDPAAAQTALHELEELCRPFFSHQQAQPSNPSPPPPPHQPRDIRRLPVTQSPRSPGKRKKNQQKKVVRQVPADGLPCDMWAWRKYGQKPIKGSPYPRGYYRCSSSKGCPARKQVERSRAEPTMLIITYTSEHNHPVPTHRNSLAGSTRNKSPTDGPSGEDNRTGSPLSVQAVTSCTMSPNTPLIAPMEENEDGDRSSTSTAQIGGDADVDEDMGFFDSDIDQEFVKGFFSETWSAGGS